MNWVTYHCRAILPSQILWSRSTGSGGRAPLLSGDTLAQQIILRREPAITASCDRHGSANIGVISPAIRSPTDARHYDRVIVFDSILVNLGIQILAIAA